MAHASGTNGVTQRTFTVGGRDADFTGLQDAVNVAEPGDTVLVRGGRYHESVSFPRSGLPGLPITVRGERNQVVLVSPAEELTGMPKPVEGHPNVFLWEGFRRAEVGVEGGDLDNMGLWEAPAHLRLKRVFSLGECERRLGSWFYDPDRQALYLRSSGLAPATDLVYMVEDASRPVFNIAQSHIVLEGVQAAFGAHGVLILGKSHHVTVRGCRLFCNRSAGIHMTGDHHVLEGNELFRNNHYGIQLRHGVSYCRIAGNSAFYNGPNNGDRVDTSLPTDIGTYTRGGYNVFEDNVIDGLHQYAFRNKAGANNTIVFRRNVVRGFFYCQSPCIRNNTVIVNSVGARFGQYINRTDTSVQGDIEAVDPEGTQRRTNIIHPAVDRDAPRFADPAYRDFRLQGDSPYRGRGAFPGETPVMFVDPAGGDDGRDGRSLGAAFRSLARAMEVVHPGDTVYLLPGVYEEALAISVGGLNEAEPLRIRAHGKSTKVILEGGVVLRAADDEVSLKDVPLAHISLEGLTLRQRPVHAENCTDLRLSYCVLGAQETALDLDSCADVHVDHVTVLNANTGVRLADCHGVSITDSLFVDTATNIVCDAASLPRFYADHNAYATVRQYVSERAVTDLDDWRATIGAGKSSRMLSVVLGEDAALPMGSPLAFGASDYTFVGARPAPAAERLEIANLRAAGLAPTVASLLWETPRGLTESRVELHRIGDGEATTVEPVSTFQIMGEYFDMTFRLSGFYTAARNATLDGLLPGTAYEARVTALNIEGTASHTETLRFKTPDAARKPATYYVGPGGDDTATGRETGAAWASFAHAARSTRPGDCVKVLPGIYRETLRPRVSGTAEQPIVYESSEPQGAVIDLMQSLSAGIAVANVNYVHIKGFALQNGSFPRGENFRIAKARGIRISACQVRYPAQSSFEKLKLAHGGLVAADAPELMVDNNVFLCGYVAVGLGSCPGAKVLHNTILGAGNYGVTIVPSSEDEEYTVRNNLFYRTVMGYKTGACLSTYNLQPQLDADYNLYYIPETHNGTIGMLSDRVRHRELDAWRAASGVDSHSVEVMPVFVDPENGDFQLKPGSPGLDAAEDGGVVGSRSL